MMKKKLIIFGVGKIAEVVHYYATEECGFDVAAFCVDKPFKKSDNFLNKPVVTFDDVEILFPASEYDMFIAIGYHDLNNLRKDKCSQAHVKGYHLVSIVSPLCKLPQTVTLGFNCFVMPPAIIHPCVRIGNNVFVWSGALIGHHSFIEDDCWLTSNCNIGGDVKIGKRVFIALNATISNSVIIGNECFIGANTLVTKKMEDGQVVISEPSKPIKLNSEQFLRISSFNSL